MRMTASKLREDIYNVLDGVIETGIPVEIVRNGRTLRIVVEDPPSKLANLVDRPDFFLADPDETARIGWNPDGSWHLRPASDFLGPEDSNLNPDGTRK